MSNLYKIKGEDGEEFGPVNGSELQVWIDQKRCSSSTLVEVDGSGNWVQLNTLSEFANSFAPQQSTPPKGDGGVSTVIPYKNVPALVGYYLAIFSGLGLLCPPAGFLLALPALVLGIIGLKKANINPEAKGKVHAWIGIIGGAFFSVAFILMIVLFLNR
jgi:hypothetical protein|tara:strand:- start:618 stop:1094 length:477 start_codon:yes stop_codon:yes gene_type:complete